MNRKIKYLICFALLMSNYLSAQLHREKAKPLVLPTFTTQRNHTLDVSVIEIKDNSPDSVFLGVVPSDEPNVRTNIVVSGGDIQNWLQSFVQQQYGAGFKPGGTKLKWIVNALSVGTDSSSAGIVSFTRLDADIYSATATDNNYQPKGNFDTIMVSNKNNPDFGQNIAVALNTLYNKSIAAVQNNISYRSDVASTGVGLSNLNNAKILSDTLYAPGIYASYQEFLNNAPSFPRFYIGVDKATNNIQLYQLTSDSTKQPVQNAWGLSVRNELYKYQDGRLYAIEKDGNGFALSKYLDYRTRKNNALFWRKNIGNKQDDKNPYDDAHIYRTPIDSSSSVRIETTHLDMRTGKLTF